METNANHQSPPSALVAWAQLVRLPNVFTVLADVGAAYLLVAQGPQPVGRFLCVLASAIALYWAGMILNDVFDVSQDEIERPSRPIPAGLISISQASRAGWGLLIVGVLLATVSGQLPSANVATTWLPALVAILLAVMIVAYDGPLKKTPLAPAAMGACRVLSFLLGASPCLVATGWPLFPRYVVGIALGFGVYIMGITTMARQEAAVEDEFSSRRSPTLSTGLLVTVIGCVLLAYAPTTNHGVVGWYLPTQAFALVIGMIAIPVLLRALRAVSDPTPAKIQTTIRVGILSIIPLAAAVAFLGAGPAYGASIFALALPAVLIAAKFRVT
ncbi:MAG: UbiA family prenyltransferase [Rubripirellula sp.]